MSYKRVLTIQDVSCVGQCSLTVALPIISACGVEACILPSAVLSTHTGGFSGFTFRDLSDDMPAIQKHWQKEGIKFDWFYTGYLGSPKQIDYVLDIFENTGVEGAVRVVDPAMADNGVLYYGFDDVYVEAMKRLCCKADILLPNITEACILTGKEYRTEYDRAYIDDLLAGLTAMGAHTVVLTGVTYREGTTGVVVLENGVYSYYEHEKIARGCHGTGDVYASAFVGSMVRGRSTFEAARIAADYTLECIKNTMGDPTHWYGVKFETALASLMQAVNNQ